jgi:hypothetical protein
VSGGIAQLFLNLGTRRGCVVSITPPYGMCHLILLIYTVILEENVVSGLRLLI